MTHASRPHASLTQAAPPPVRHLHLVHDRRRWRALPQPFPGESSPRTHLVFPRLPRSHLSWLASLSRSARQGLGRCLAVLLFIDLRTGTWLDPVLPTQICRAAGASWRWRPEDFGRLPPYAYLAGSHQTSLGDPDSASERVPAFDGLHLIEVIQGDQASVHWFVRREGSTQETSPEGFCVDDWHIALARHERRMEVV